MFFVSAIICQTTAMFSICMPLHRSHISPPTRVVAILSTAHAPLHAVEGRFLKDPLCCCDYTNAVIDDMSIDQ